MQGIWKEAGNLIAITVALVGAGMWSLRKHRIKVNWWKEEDGWVYPQMGVLMGNTEMQALLTDVSKDQDRWEETCTEGWFEALQSRSEAELLRLTWECVQGQLAQPFYMKSVLSAAAIIHSTRLPARLWVVNRETLEYVARWEILRGLRWVQETEVCLPVVESVHYPTLVAHLSQDTWFIEHVLRKGREMPLFWRIHYEYVNVPSLLPWVENPVILKKAITTVCTLCGVGVPRDCWYYDSEVDVYLKTPLRHAA